MNWIVALVIGGVIGFMFSFVVFYLRMPIAGVLRIELSDPDGPFLFVELTGSVHSISKEKYVTFAVNPKSYISQK